MSRFTPQRRSFIRALAQKLAAAGVKYPAYEAARFVIENPEMENTWTIEAAAEEWLSCALRRRC